MSRIPDPSEIAALFESFDPKGPGACIGIYSDGELVFDAGFGYASVEHKAPITADTVFDIASTSKQFTAACVLLLAEEGKVDLDDDIRKFFEDFRLDEKVSIRQLMHHTSGLRDIYSLFSMVGWTWPELMTDEQVIEILSRQRSLSFSPGTSHSYSNSGYVLLSALVRQASGQTLDQFAQDRIFKPLGMSSSGFRDDITSVIPHRAGGYTKNRDGDYRLDESPSGVTGDGALNTTIRDFARWESNFILPVVGGESFRGHQLETAKLKDGSDTGYAAGLSVATYKGLNVVGHSGAWAGFRADYLRFPDQKLAIAIFCNIDSANPSGLSRHVADLCLAGEISSDSTPEVKAGDPVELKEVKPGLCAGLYGDGATFVRVDEGDAGGILLKIGGREIAACPSDDGSFVATDLPVAVSFMGTPDSIETLVVRHSGRVLWTLTRVQAAPPDESIAGCYYNDEVDATWTIKVSTDGLEIDRSPRKAISLACGPADLYIASGFCVTFERQNAGPPRALVASDGRAKGLRFERIES